MEFDFKYDGGGFAKAGTGTLSVDGKAVDRKHIEHTTPVNFQWDESFDVDVDTRTPVTRNRVLHDTSFRFTGKIEDGSERTAQ